MKYPNRMYETDLCCFTLEGEVKFKDLFELEVKLGEGIGKSKVIKHEFSWGNLSLRRRKELRERRLVISEGKDK